MLRYTCHKSKDKDTARSIQLVVSFVCALTYETCRQSPIHSSFVRQCFAFFLPDATLTRVNKLPLMHHRNVTEKQLVTDSCFQSSGLCHGTSYWNVKFPAFFLSVSTEKLSAVEEETVKLCHSYVWKMCCSFYYTWTALWVLTQTPQM